ncbi:MAG TPA: GH3 auxin-responsive promoter family protein, partial [Dongiaceae bacterium]|nr:GH3 auxin-responsive promoter family protein [Dongiaceae bacterium]
MGNGPYDLLSGIYRPLLEKNARAWRDPESAQRERLASILGENADTDVGRRHGFSSIGTPEEFAKRVPAIGFEEMAADVERVAHGERNVLTAEPVLRFVKTSGTTGAAKRIPVTKSIAREVTDAQLVWLVNLLRENPKHADGTKLNLVSPADEDLTPAGIPVGANTGRMAREMPWYVRMFAAPHRDVLAIKDPAVRSFCVALACAGADAGTLTTANPSTVWLLAKRLRAWADPLAEWLGRGGLPDKTPDGVPIDAELRARVARRFRKRAKQAARLR